MSWRKIENFLNSKLGIGIMAAILAFIAGVAVGSGSSYSSADKDTNLTKRSLVQSQQTVREQKGKINELQKKVDEAEPYYKMKDEEKEKLKEQEKVEEEKHKQETEAKEKAKAEAKNKLLSSGNYEAGKDFEPGTYDIEAVSGAGNVYSSNSYNGGINAILGSDEKIKQAASIGMGDMYKKEYKNVELPKGAKLKIDGVEVKLIAKN